MKLRLLAIAMTAGLVLALAGCGDSEEKKPIPTLNSSTPTAEKSTGTLLDKVPKSAPERPKDVKTEAGAKAFAIYVPKMLDYTIASGDLEPMADASAGSCKTCLKFLTDTKANGNLQIGDEPIEPTGTTITASKGDTFELKQRCPFSKSILINRKSGDLVDNVGGIVYDMTLTVKWTAESWRIADYAVKEAK